MTCWAEHLRFHGIRDVVGARELRSRPWAASVELPADYVHLTFDNADKYGIAPSALIDDDWRECQDWIATRGPLDALIAPSAALPGTENLVMFGPRVRSRWHISPRDPSLEVPCEPIADIAQVVEDLLSHVRWRGTGHAGYEAWTRGQPQPLPPRVRVNK